MTDLLSILKKAQNVEEYNQFHWSGTFAEYLELVKKKPQITRNAFERIYDMVLSYGTEEYVEFKKKIVRYNFFEDPFDRGRDAIYGLDIHLMKLVNVFKSAAHRYGTEKRVVLLHGPVGSSKSTIVRLLKKGLEQYSKTDEGAFYTYQWVHTDETVDKEEFKPLFDEEEFVCPMHEEPLKLIPKKLRPEFLSEINRGRDDYKVTIEGDVCPACNFMVSRLIDIYKGDWTKVLDHIRVKRFVLSEKQRIGIGTFQPKDEKNQDSPERIPACTKLQSKLRYRIL